MATSPSCRARRRDLSRFQGRTLAALSPPGTPRATNARGRTGRRARRRLPPQSLADANGSRRRTRRPLGVLEVCWVEQLLLRALDPLSRPHALDQLLPSFCRPDHDRPPTAVLYVVPL